MALNYKTISLFDNLVHTVLERPSVMTRVFFGIYIVAMAETAFSAHISFNDPKFVNFIPINNVKMYYEFECKYIPQGNIFVKKMSDAVGSISAIEILK